MWKSLEFWECVVTVSTVRKCTGEFYCICMNVYVEVNYLLSVGGDNFVIGEGGEECKGMKRHVGRMT